MTFKTMPRFDHECFDGRIPWTLFTCEICGWSVKIRDDEID